MQVSTPLNLPTQYPSLSGLSGAEAHPHQAFSNPFLPRTPQRACAQEYSLEEHDRA
jgi:hypothetical protein